MNARFGPPKGYPRALVKTKEGLKEEKKGKEVRNGEERKTRFGAKSEATS